VEGAELSPDAPVTLEWDNGEGLIFRRRISLDENYMFTVGQSVENIGDATVSLAPYGYVARRGQPDTVGFYILHEGAIGKFDGVLEELDYGDLEDLDGVGGPGERQQLVPWPTPAGSASPTSTGWPRWPRSRAALRRRLQIRADRRAAGIPDRDAPAAVTVAPGETAELHPPVRRRQGLRHHQAYEDERGIAGFEDSIDWGWFFFLTKPIFQLLMF
jgi:YidC/Oxa1 family membrane protein insertase